MSAPRLGVCSFMGVAQGECLTSQLRYGTTKGDYPTGSGIYGTLPTNSVCDISVFRDSPYIQNL